MADQGLFRQDCMCRKLATLMLDAVKAQKASQDQPAMAMGTDQVDCCYKSSESLCRGELCRAIMSGIMHLYG